MTSNIDDGVTSMHCRLQARRQRHEQLKSEFVRNAQLAISAGTLTPVFRCSDYIEAHLLSGLLRQNGINTFLQGALLQGGLGELPAMGHLIILVDESDRAAAQLILAAYERGELELDEEQDG